ncbi:hypothetical protein [Oceanivirga salmonicida]|uniref:hypothetical protein n=1 Tax=Oceanivirga salmonicida TaxID=1769291 RepID=UPI000834A204|nr:hypothetical protein [Oceanivirga salmonicida]
MKIKFKFFDIQKLSIFKISLVIIMFILTIKIMYIFFMFLIFLLIINLIISYIYIKFKLNLEIYFLENELHIIKGKLVFKLKYSNIKMINITDNLFSSKNISLNYEPKRTEVSFFNTFHNIQYFSNMTNAIFLPNVVNYEEILDKLSKKININIKNKCIIQVSYSSTIKDYMGNINYIIYIFTVIFMLLSEYSLIWLIIMYIFINLPFLKNKKYFIDINDNILKVESKNNIYFFIDNFEVDGNKLYINVFFPEPDSKILVGNQLFKSECGISRKLTIE